MKQKIFNILLILSFSGCIFSITLGLILSRINFNPLKYYFRTDNITCEIKNVKDITLRTQVKDKVRKENSLLNSSIFQEVKTAQLNQGLGNLINRSLTIYDIKFLENCEKVLFLSANEDISNNFDNLIKNKPIFSSFNELEKTLNNKVPLKEDIYVDIRWNDLLDNLNEDSRKKMQQYLLDFYNRFSNYYTKDSVIQLLFTIIRKRDILSDNVIGVTVSNIASLWQFIAFSSEFNNEDSIKFQFNSGFWSSNNIVTPVVHEYGHALENYYNSRKDMRKFFNKQIYPCDFEDLKDSNSDPKAHYWKYYYDVCFEAPLELKRKNQTESLISEKVSSFFVEWLSQQASIKEILQKRLFAWSVVRSNYARTNSLRELFAEAFAQWLLTPINERTIKWELLNNFFTNVLPKFDPLIN